MAAASARADRSAGAAPGPRGRFAWALYDWAAQPYFTIIFTFVFGPYFVNQVAADPEHGQVLWASAHTFAGIGLALLAPFLGAYADEAGPRKPWVTGFSALTMLACLALWFAVPGAEPWRVQLVILAVVLGVIGAEAAIVFNNAMLPALAAPNRMGALSGLGWALGYAGALIALPIMLWLTGQLPGVAGPDLDPERHVAERLAGPFVAVWFALFMLPFLLWTPDQPRRAGGRLDAARRSLRGTLATLRSLPSRPNLLRYLLARMAYYDGLNAVFAFGGVYAAARFGWSTTELGLFGIIILLFGVPGCLVGGWMDDRFGSKQTLYWSVSGLFLAMLGILSIGDGEVLFGVPMAFPVPGGGLFAAPAEWLLIGFAVLLGLSAGPAQSASRSLVGRIAPQAELGKYYGLYALSGKATSFVAPLSVALLIGPLGERWAYAVILLLIAIGLALLSGVREEREPSS